MNYLNVFAVYGLKHIYNVEPIYLVYRPGIPSIIGAYDTTEQAQNFCARFNSLNKYIYNSHPIRYFNQSASKSFKLHYISSSLYIEFKKVTVHYLEDAHMVEVQKDILDEKTMVFLKKYFSIIIQKNIISKNIEKDIIIKENKKLNN